MLLGWFPNWDETTDAITYHIQFIWSENKKRRLSISYKSTSNSQGHKKYYPFAD